MWERMQSAADGFPALIMFAQQMRELRPLWEKMAISAATALVTVWTTLYAVDYEQAKDSKDNLETRYTELILNQQVEIRLNRERIDVLQKSIKDWGDKTDRLYELLIAKERKEK